MAGRTPEHDHGWATDDDRGGAITALLVALLLDAAIIGLFLFITWAAYAMD